MEITVVVSQNTKIEVMYDPSVPLLGINRKESKSHYSNTVISMVTSALLTIAKISDSTGEWVKKM